ncbi:MAG: hypothetical protein ACKE9I_04370 [Methylophagaceae bacterium]
MSNIKSVCKACGDELKGSSLQGVLALSTGGVLGGFFGKTLGIAWAMEPIFGIGAMAGTIPAAIIGSTIIFLTSKQFLRCVKCKKYLKL